MAYSAYIEIPNVAQWMQQAKAPSASAKYARGCFGVDGVYSRG